LNETPAIVHKRGNGIKQA